MGVYCVRKLRKNDGGVNNCRSVLYWWYGYGLGFICRKGGHNCVSVFRVVSRFLTGFRVE